MNENADMQKKEQNEKEIAMEKFCAFVVEEIKLGRSKQEISSQLVEKGLDAQSADILIEKNFVDVNATIKSEKITLGSLLHGVLGGLVAALVGGLIWCGIVMATGYEIGYVAWGLGIFCGFGVVFFAGGKKGLPLQVIALLSSILGIVCGKYFIFYYSVKKAVTTEVGEAAAAEVELFSMKLFTYFVEHAKTIFTGHDILWIIFAVISAWKIAESTKHHIKAHTPK